MSDPNPPTKKIPRRKSLRFRVVYSVITLAIVPFLISMGVLFFIARSDVEELNGDALIQEAGFMAGLVENEIERMDQWAAELAAREPVRAHVLARAPFPDQLVRNALHLNTGALTVRIHLLDVPGNTPPHDIMLSDAGQILVRRAITNDAGVALGVLEVDFSGEEIFQKISGYRRGHRGAATLQSPAGLLAASDQAHVSLPREALWGVAGWSTVEEKGETYYIGKMPVNKADNDIRGSWRVVVILSSDEVFNDFNSVAAQAAIMLTMLTFVLIGIAERTASKFLKPILEMSSGAEIISRINLSHRLNIDTGDELEMLAGDFNVMAESLQNAYGELEDRVGEMTRALEEERNRLVTILRTMAEGLVVLNDAGEVTLMNPRAKAALSTGPSSGIGAPLARMLPGQRLEFHMRRLRSQWEEGDRGVERVLFPLPDGKVLRGVLSAVPDPAGARAGFLLLFRDITEDAEREREFREVVGALPAKLKGSLTSMSSMIDILSRRCDIDPVRHATFLSALDQEAHRSVQVLREFDETSPDIRFARWPIQPADAGALVEEALGLEHGIFAELKVPDTPLPPVAVEPFSWVAAMSTVLRWVISKTTGLKPIELALDAEEEAVVLTYRTHEVVDANPDELAKLTVAPAGEKGELLTDVIAANRAEIWTRKIEGGTEVRLAMTRASVLPEYAPTAEIVDDHPEFYDFDLFTQRPGIEPRAQLNAKLSELEYVVFDTETTGLNPSQGDKIISISGVRVRGEKVMRADTFHALVNPGMRIPKGSIKIHGITDEEVADAPDICAILPQFIQWAGDAVLVAHNAAFDIKMLEVSTKACALAMVENPVLDTLLLSYGAHRDLEGHGLDAMAKRMGIVIEGRHTSLGDALATAQIFVHLLPILASRGVSTLAEAKRFCDKMLLLKWQASRY